jgi:wobble nucleotide-excising tRNase
MSHQVTTFANINDVAVDFRKTLQTKKYVLLYAYNGVGKTRLSMAFKNIGKNGDKRDTLYFNAFTEDLFFWDNDLDNDTQRVLRMNKASRFFSGLEELEMENRIRPLLQRYADFDFRIDPKEWTVNFSREISVGDKHEKIEHIKISRGEENIFIWCFFLAIAQLAIDEQEAYKWVKFLYIDDPISSLDDNNAIAVASHLARLLKNPENKIKTVISSHHTLFFNVMCNELLKGKDRPQFFLSKNERTGEYSLRNTGATPRFYHVAMLKELHKAAETGMLYTYHFNILRHLLEKTATFHGFDSFSDCIKQDADDEDGTTYTRIINILSHGNYSLFEPVEMLEENKEYFRKVLNNFMRNYRFNPELFPEEQTTQAS